jgi:hypothetical protein
MKRSERKNVITTMVMIKAMIVFVYVEADYNYSPLAQSMFSDFGLCFFDCFKHECYYFSSPWNIIPTVYTWCLGNCGMKCPPPPVH